MMKIEKLYRYMKSGINVLFKPLSVNSKPLYFQFEPTTYCNLNCASCSREELINSEKNMSFEEFRKVFDSIKPAKIAMSGIGEPFLNKDLYKMIKYAKKNNCSTLTTSNFTIIDEERAEKIVESGLDLLKISIDASNKETYKLLRGEDYFDKILESVELMNEIKAKKAVSLPHLRFQFVVQGKNYKEIPDVIKLAAEKGVEAVFLQPIVLTFLEDNMDFFVKDFDLDHLKEILKSSQRLAAQVGVSTNIDLIMKNFDYYFLGKRIDEGKKKICIMPWFSFFLQIDGDVRPCCAFAESNPYLGNVNKKDFNEIWNSKEYKKFRKLVRKGEYPFPTCKECVPPVMEDLLDLKNVLPGFLGFNKNNK